MEGGSPIADVRLSETHGSVLTRHDPYPASKAVADFLIALVGLIVLSPVMLFAAIAVKISSPGPVLYRHERVGRDGVSFDAYKFRSMRADVELTPAQVEQFRTHYKIADDPRITTVGRWLRRSSIDEMPQLLNVLTGRMAIVGPRPVTRRELDEKYRERASLLVSTRPGLTGLWQVSGRSLLTYDERIALDLKYVRERSFLMDLKILVRTPLAVLLMRGSQ